MPAPRTRPVSGSKQQLGQAVGAVDRQRAAGGRPREGRLLVGDRLLGGLGLGQPDPRDLGVGVGDRRDPARVERRRRARRSPRRRRGPRRRLVGEHRRRRRRRRSRRCAATFVRCWASTRDEPALVDVHARLRPGPSDAPFGIAADRDQHAVEDGVGSTSPENVACRPSSLASILSTLVSRWIAS